MLNRGIAVLVIALLIALAFAPSIYADESEEELVEVTTELCRLNKKHTVQLTHVQAEQLDSLFDDIRERLDKVETREETIEIFNKAILELDKYGLLGGLSVEQAQKLVTEQQQHLRITDFLKQMKTFPKNENGNSFCSISGHSSYTPAAGLFTIGCAFLAISLFIRSGSLWTFLERNTPKFEEFLINSGLYKLIELSYWTRIAFWGAISLTAHFIPVKIGSLIEYGWFEIVDEFYNIERIPAEGWIHTNGLYGVKNWDGKFEGRTIGFTGIKITKFPLEQFYLGYAISVEIEPW